MAVLRPTVSNCLISKFGDFLTSLLDHMIFPIESTATHVSTNTNPVH